MKHKLFKTKGILSKYDGKGVYMRGLRLIIILLISTILCYNVSAASIAVTKAVMNYQDVLKGGYAEDYVYVSTDTEFDVPLEYEVIGDVQGWISVSPDINNQTVYVNRSKIQELRIIIQPPVDTPTGNYTGGVRIITGTLNNPEGPYGSQLQAAFLIRINIEVTGTERIECNIGGLNIPDTEIGNPLEFSMTVSNTGNVRVRPNVSIDVWNQDQSTLLNSLTIDFNRVEVLPTTSRVLMNRFDNNYRIGQYWAYATVYPCQKSELISFSVLEKGSIADYGDLLRIENKPWASTGEAVPITAVFKNNGERVVSAKFKGVVQQNEKVVQVLDSDFYDVAQGEINNIQVFFTPKKLGQYTISGRVLYNNKLTYEKSSILNVNTGEEITSFNLTYIVIIIIIIIIILLLLIKIKKKKQKINRF